MSLDDVVCAALWEWLQLRQEVARRETDLWLNIGGKPKNPNWFYQMLKRKGKRAGIENLHTHRFRYSYAINAGWKEVPPTYLRPWLTSIWNLSTEQ